MKNRYAQNAFTLIELLVAVTLIVTILAMVLAAYFAASKSARACTSRITITRQHRSAIEQMARQVRGCYVPPSFYTPSDITPASTQDPQNSPRQDRITSEAKFTLPENHNYFHGNTGTPGGDILQMVTANAFFAAPDQPTGLYLVTYSFDRSSRQLLLSREPFLGSTQTTPAPHNWQAVADHIDSVELAYFDGQTWQPLWDFSQTRKLPRAVKIAITGIDHNERRYEYETIAAIDYSNSDMGENQTGKLLARRKQ